MQAEVEQIARSKGTREEFDFSAGFSPAPKFDFEAGYKRNVEAISGRRMKKGR